MEAQLKKRLEAMVKLPENLKCADCRKRGIIAVSINKKEMILLFIHYRSEMGIGELGYFHMY